ncbi:hypothetical protein [Niabella aquatica]
MNEVKRFVVVYDYNSLSSYLWLNNNKKWFMFPFLDGRDVYPDMKKNFNRVNYETLPERLRKEIELDNLHEDIKAIYEV